VRSFRSSIHWGHEAMSNLRSLWPIALCGALLSSACTEDHPVECNAACVAALKREPLTGKSFPDPTEEQWQAAFDTATSELAKGDWATRLSAIQQEFCRTPGKVDYAKVRSLEDDMNKKRALETMNRRIDITAAMTHPESAAGAKALTKIRDESMETSILKVKVQEIMQSCYVPGTVNTPAN
jgi:hypothetical protein